MPKKLGAVRLNSSLLHSAVLQAPDLPLIAQRVDFFRKSCHLNILLLLRIRLVFFNKGVRAFSWVSISSFCELSMCKPDGLPSGVRLEGNSENRCMGHTQSDLILDLSSVIQWFQVQS